MKKILFALLVLFFPVAMLVAAESDPDVPPPDKAAGVDLRDSEVVQKGMNILSSICGGYCHGTEGRGFKAPSLRNRTDLNVDSLRTIILNGRKRAGKLMPPWNGVLSEQEVWTVIAAIVSLRHVESDAGADGKSGAH
ncbi:MAG: cytochrome c [Betaproteobacteria bacterium]|nr:cytochrome c [Betaproteobacteria bacterium]